MGALFSIVDSTQDNQVARVLASNALKTQQQFSYLTLSATGTGTIKSSQGWLSKITLGGTAAAGKLAIFDSAVASAIAANVTAQLAGIDTHVRGTYLYDILSAGAMSYRLSAIDIPDGVTIVYA